MNKLVILLLVVIGLVAIFGAIGIGLSVFLYGIYTLFLMAQGSVAVSFFTVLKIIGCWAFAAPIAWIWFFSFMYPTRFITSSKINQ